MTCIAGAIRDNEVWIGADGVSINLQSECRAGRSPKVFERNGMLFGVSGTVHVHQLIRYRLEFPSIVASDDPLTFLVTLFVPALRNLVIENGGECTTRNSDKEMDARLLIGTHGRLFVVDSGYGIWEPVAPYAAVGCADQLALAAMFTVHGLRPRISAREMVERGLLAAAEFDALIRPPFTILKLGE